MANIRTKTSQITPNIIRDREGNTYKKVTFLGKGAFSYCFRYKCINTKQDYAVKIIRKQHLNKNDEFKLFQEVELHQTLNHPNIVKFFKYFDDPHFHFILLQLCEQETLFHLIERRGRLCELEIQSYLMQIIRGLSYLHQKCQVVHRDIKLANLFIKKMQIQIGDFGLAKKIGTKGKTQSFCGTPSYMAPEVVLENGYSFHVDIWGLGVTVYAMLTGFSPFEGFSLPDTTQRILKGNISFPVPASKEIKSLISFMLKRDPSKRPKLITILKHPFFSTNIYPEVLPVTSLNYPLQSAYITKFLSNKNGLPHKNLSLQEPIESLELQNLWESQLISTRGSNFRTTNEHNTLLNSKILNKEQYTHYINSSQNSSTFSLPQKHPSPQEKHKEALKATDYNTNILIRENNLQPSPHKKKQQEMKKRKELPESHEAYPYEHKADRQRQNPRERELERWQEKENVGIERSGECPNERKHIVTLGDKEAHNIIKQMDTRHVSILQSPYFQSSVYTSYLPESSIPDLCDQISLMSCNIQNPYNQNERRIDNSKIEESKEGTNPMVYVKRWIDARDKGIGFGYVMSDGAYAVCFLNNTTLIRYMRPPHYLFITEIFNRDDTITSLKKTFDYNAIPPDLQKQTQILLELMGRLKMFPSFQKKQENTRLLIENKKNKNGIIEVFPYKTEENLCYIHLFLPWENSILFKLSNGQIQVHFRDLSHIIVDGQAEKIFFVTKNETEYIYSFNDLKSNKKIHHEGAIRQKLEAAKFLLKKLIKSVYEQDSDSDCDSESESKENKKNVSKKPENKRGKRGEDLKKSESVDKLSRRFKNVSLIEEEKFEERKRSKEEHRETAPTLLLELKEEEETPQTKIQKQYSQQTNSKNQFGTSETFNAKASLNLSLHKS